MDFNSLEFLDPENKKQGLLKRGSDALSVWKIIGYSDYFTFKVLFGKSGLYFLLEDESF